MQFPLRIRLLAIGLLVAAAGMAVGFMLGRSGAKEPAPPASSGPVVARWAGGQLTAGALRERILAQKNAAGLSALDPARARTFSDAALRSALLAAEARRRGLEHDPRVEGELAEALARRLLELELEGGAKHGAVSAAEITSYYQQHREEYVHPERVRLHRLDSDAGIASMSRAELEAQLGPEHAARVWLMVGVGEVSPGLATDAGVVRFRLEGREPGRDVSLEQARAQIESRLWYARRDVELDRLVSSLESQLKLEVDQQALAAVLAELR